MRRNLLALGLTLGLASLSGPALAAVCTPTPALPDTERRTEYAGIVAQTGPFNVGFQLYGDSTDYGNWVSVWVNGVALTPVTDFTVTSPTGPLANLCRPITDAQVTFTAAQTGTIEIEGSRRPRRTSQVSENAGVTARTFNQVVSDMTAQLRERWDRQSRLVRSPPGEALAVLPPAATRAGKFLVFDTTGLIPGVASGAGSGNVVGPGASVVGNLAVWNNATGTLLRDNGPARAGLVAPGATLYVNPSASPATCNGGTPQTCQPGSDAVGITCTTIAAPCLTINNAVNLALVLFDARQQQVTIQLADGTHAAANVQMTANMLGARSGGNGTQAQLIIQGNTSNLDAVNVQGAGPPAFTFVGVTSPVSLRYMKLTTTGASAHGISADAHSMVYYSNIDFGSTTGAHMSATFGSFIEQEGPETISGGGTFHWSADRNSKILTQGFGINCGSGAWNFSQAFINLGNASTFLLGPSTFSNCGSVTGTRYASDVTSSFGFGTADPNTVYPGNANGSIALPSYNRSGVPQFGGGGPMGDSGLVTFLAPANGSLLWWNGSTLANLSSANNATLITDSGGFPSISATLPVAVQNNISATNLTTGTLPAARMPALTGDCTTTTGTVATTCAGKVSRVKIQKFTANGTYTPSTGILHAIIECIGGGGGGGSASGTAGQYYGGGGGGSGGYSRVYVTAATIGASQTVTVGGGGNGGASGSNNGVTGSNTSVGTLCVSNGGLGGSFGSAAQSGAGGAGGAAGTGDVAGTGNVGTAGLYSGVTNIAFPSGNGASSAFGGGAAGLATGSATCAAGNNAGNYGGGGSGAICNNVGATSAAGGNGSTGIVVVTEFANQ